MVVVRRSWPAWPAALKTLRGLVLRQCPAHLHELQVSAFVQLVCLEEWNQRFPQFPDAFVDLRFYSRRVLATPGLRRDCVANAETQHPPSNCFRCRRSETGRRG